MRTTWMGGALGAAEGKEDELVVHDVVVQKKYTEILDVV